MTKKEARLPTITGTITVGDIVSSANTEKEIYTRLEHGLQWTIEEDMDTLTYLYWVSSATRFRYKQFEPWKIVFVQNWVKIKLDYYEARASEKLTGAEVVKKYYTRILNSTNRTREFDTLAVKHRTTPGAIKIAWTRHNSKGTK